MHRDEERSRPYVLSARVITALAITALAITGLLLGSGCGSADDPSPDATVDGGDAAVDLAVDLAPDLVPDLAPDLAPDLPPPPVIDIRADTNRDGVVDLADPTEDADEESWDASHGAVFLANLDDDDQSCPAVGNQSDIDLAACHDAADEALDGDKDLEDLAPLRVAPWTDAPDGVTATVAISLPNAGPRFKPADVARLFVADAAGDYAVLAADQPLDAAALRQGVTLALEGKDIVRDDGWDGYVDVTLTVRQAPDAPAPAGDAGAGGAVLGSDTVRLRLAPVLTSHHLQPAERIFVSASGGPDSAAFIAGIDNALQGAGSPSGTLIELSSWDQWTQDFFETGWMSMPAAGGGQHAITVLLRSPNVEVPDDPMPLRLAGRLMYTLRGQDVAVVQQFDLKHDGSMQSLNSLGNLETVPPYDHGGQSYPMGRIVMGSEPSYHPDPSFTKMLEQQRVQPPIWVDTSWLLVGHIDETTSYVPVTSARGWALVLNDATLAKQMLEDASAAGHGAVKIFAGKAWLDDKDKELSAETTIDAVLADAEVMAASAKAVVEVAAQLATLKQETGITDDEIIPLPFLHFEIAGFSVAYQPGTVNSTLIAPGHWLAPETHGPQIGGVDIFKKQLEESFAPHKITVHYTENWDLYHRLMGEVHCGTNALRSLPAARWWESGR